jgi:hypothetical protein
MQAKYQIVTPLVQLPSRRWLICTCMCIRGGWGDGLLRGYPGAPVDADPIVRRAVAQCACRAPLAKEGSMIRTSRLHFESTQPRGAQPHICIPPL